MRLRPGHLRAIAHVLLALPLAWLCWRWGHFASGTSSRLAGLTADPIAYTIDYLGLWALRSLIATLCITPIARIVRWNAIMAVRRAVGLWTFAYAGLHLSVYLGLDLLGDLGELWADVAKHRFILFGMAAFVALTPLAVTSTRGWIKRLGSRRWQRLHWLVYPAIALAGVHFILRVKGFQEEPWVYMAIIVTLLLLRPGLRYWKRARARGSAPGRTVEAKTGQAFGA